MGTGRIALPLHERGIRLAGADIAEAMLRRLVVNADGVLPFPLLLADATRLPLADGTFGSVLAVHVLHLIPAWRDARGGGHAGPAPGRRADRVLPRRRR